MNPMASEFVEAPFMSSILKTIDDLKNLLGNIELFQITDIKTEKEEAIQAFVEVMKLIVYDPLLRQQFVYGVTTKEKYDAMMKLYQKYMILCKKVSLPPGYILTMQNHSFF